MSKTIGCKHLDFTEGKYIDCEIVTLGTQGVRCWERHSLPYPEAPRLVQFCGLGRGRINDPFDCYSAPGPCGCYVLPEEPKP